jgi:hypothetical protein
MVIYIYIYIYIYINGGILKKKLEIDCFIAYHAKHKIICELTSMIRLTYAQITLTSLILPYES